MTSDEAIEAVAAQRATEAERARCVDIADKMLMQAEDMENRARGSGDMGKFIAARMASSVARKIRDGIRGETRLVTLDGAS